MLSKAAFNALLKTLEEPPEHVKFLLATTDPEKLPVTVLSRCLQFNLKRLDEEQIGGQIARILEAEGIAADAGAIRQLAQGRRWQPARRPVAARPGDRLYRRQRCGSSMTAVATMLGTVDRTRSAPCSRRWRAAMARGCWRQSATLARVLARLGRRAGCPGRCAASRAGAASWCPDVAVRGERVDVDALAARLAPGTGAALVPDGAQRPPRPAARAEPARRLRDEPAAHARVPAGGRRGDARAPSAGIA